MLKKNYIQFTLFLVLASFISVVVFQTSFLVDEEETEISKESKDDVENKKLETSKDDINHGFLNEISKAIFRLFIPKINFNRADDNSLSSISLKIVIPPPEV